MKKPVIAAAAETDLSAVLELNEAALPHVSSLTLTELRALAGQASYFSVAHVDGTLAGFLLALAPGQSYQSLNYQWFCRQYDNFVYVDRIVIAEDFRGLGLGKAFYRDIERAHAGHAPWLTCEVNVRPPNPESLEFHRKLGFEEVGQQDTDGGKKRVSLLAKPIRPLQIETNA